MFQKTGFLKRSGEEKQKEKYLILFIVAFVGMMISFIPTMITNDGIFLYYGDFNSQQVMFYKHANDMVREGNFGWDWGTDLGANFIGSYSFYLLGSPFFWLSTLFPKGAVPFLLPWFLSLKTAVAAVTSYAYIRRFVQNRDACFIGAMLYAFSGFQTYNVFFNHFHDVTAFFPLMLLGFELLVQDKKKGAFAIAVAICASISYFFFVCEVVFMIIYFVIRCTDKDFNMNLKIFGRLAFESILGVMISAIIFLPACIDVITNPRITSYLYGKDMVFYSENVRIPRIFQAFFMLSDMPARINILSSDKGKWASIAGYLPMFSMCGVIAYMRTKKKDWASKMIWVCMIMACIPVLNASFVLFNSSYYARWFYMPILIMCLMTAKILEDKENNDIKKGFIPVLVVGLFFIIVGLLPTQENGKTVLGKVPEFFDLYCIQAIVTVVMLIMLGYAIYVLKKGKNYYRAISWMTVVACVICMTSSVVYGAAQGDYIHYDYITRGIHGGENLDLEKFDEKYDSGSENTFYRIDTSPDVDNWCMFWNLSSMRTFHSVVPTSIIDFYQNIGQTRDVASRMETNLYPLRGLFSVRYYFDQLSSDQLQGKASNNPSDTHSDLEGFKYVDTQNGFNIYENENWIPMGFAYDQYVSDNVIKNAENVDKTNILLKALVLNDQQAVKYAGIMSYYDETSEERTRDTYVRDCKEKQANSCYYFKYDSNGFDAKIKLDKDKLVFFSVPYESGWTATVNGGKADIEKVSYGFMAVLCHAGENEIHFDYKTTGLTAGKILTGTGLVILIAYAGYPIYKKRRRSAAVSDHPANKKKSK